MGNADQITRPKRLIGLDPGLRFLGWGIIEAEQNRLIHIANGTIKSTRQREFAARLVELEAGLENVMQEYAPTHAAVENTFVNRDSAASLRLGQARAICLLVPARCGLRVAEYAPNMIKKSLTGSGHADKGQMQAMINMLLPHAKLDSEHAVDALAVAITHAHAGRLQKRLAKKSVSPPRERKKQSP